MGVFAFPTCSLIFLFLLLIGLIGRHLFFHSAFTPPDDSSNVQIKRVKETPFLLENNLPYPAGIQTTDREGVSLDGIWSFHLDDVTESVPVHVPSCFNTADSPLRDHQGAVWYEKEFILPDWREGSLIRLAFLGSFYRTEAWLDGEFLGSHEGGYLPFFFDISTLVSPHSVHRLKVRVDNRVGSTDLPPLLFRGHNLGWHPYGGLHRSVFIEICPPAYCFKIHVDTEIKRDRGRMQIAALIHRAQGNAHPLQTLTLGLLTDAGQTITKTDVPIHWDNDGQFGIAESAFEVSNPRLWEPGSPYLYRVAIQSIYERCETRVGFRDVRAGDGKLFLNGKYLLLKGVCRHQENRLDGLAQKREDVQKELKTIQNLHGNFVRLAHYPHSSETLDLCDQMGLCAWTEIPLYQAGLGLLRYLFDKTKRTTGKVLWGLPVTCWNTGLLGNPDLLVKARNELLKMIERDRNHPSVLFWGLGNECWSLNPAGAKALAWLRKQAETFDSGRLFGYAAHALPVLGPLFECAFDVSDVVSVNEYFGWYYGRAQDAGAHLQKLAHKYPDKPLLVTETGSDTVLGRHTLETPPPRGYSEEYQMWYLDEQWRQMRSVPTFSGLSIWVLKDFLCPEYREDNPVSFYNLKGLLDRDGRPKAAYEKVKSLFGRDA